MKGKFLPFLLSLTIIFSPLGSQAMDLGILEKVANGEVISRQEKNSFEKLFSAEELGLYRQGEVPMLPIRKLLEGLGYEIRWNKELRQVDIFKDAWTTSIKPGQNYYFKDKEPIRLSQAPEIKDGETYVPLGFFESILGEPIILAGESVGIFRREIILKEKDSLELEGYIKNIYEEDSRISILVGLTKSDFRLGEILVHIVEDTEVYDSLDQKISARSLLIGDRVRLETPIYMTMSLPAQTTAKRVNRYDFIRLENKLEDDFNYPLMTFKENQKVESLFTQKIEDFIGSLRENDLFVDLKLDYSISSLDSEILSLVFRGKFTYLGEETDLIRVFNIDLKSGQELNFSNYFKSDVRSQELLKDLLRKEVKKNYNKDFEAEGLYIYFRENFVVVYYYEMDDRVSVPLEIYLDREEIKELVK